MQTPDGEGRAAEPLVRRKGHWGTWETGPDAGKEWGLMWYMLLCVPFCRRCVLFITHRDQRRR